MSNLIRRKFGDDLLPADEVTRLAVLKHHKNKLDLKVGDMLFYGSDRDLIKILRFEVEKHSHHGNKYEKHLIYYAIWDIETQQWEQQSRGGSQHYTDGSYDRFFGCKFTGDPTKYLSEALEVIKSGDITKYMIHQTKSEEEDTGLMHVGSKESLEAVKGDLENTVNQIEIISGFMHLEMERRKYEIEKVKQRLQEQVVLFEKKIEKLHKVILTIELFLGVEEFVYQLQEGPAAPSDAPICVRQTLYYMDEEVGDPGQDLQGLEFKSIKDFDTWVVKDKNYTKLVPESKGIAALQIRRNKKDRGQIDNPYIKMHIEAQDKYTYLLLRNGDNVYRLGTDKLEFRPRMFPNKKELQDLKNVWDDVDQQEAKLKKESGYSYSPDLSEGQQEILRVSEVEGGRFSNPDFTELREGLENSVMNYKMKFMVLQGLIMRTQIFHPLAKPISFFNAKSQEDDLVKLIFDDELCLPTGRLPFHDWLQELNEKIHEGSRIVLGWTHSGKEDVRGQKVRSYSYYEERPGRFDDRYKERGDSRNSWVNTPNEPKNGLYYLSNTVRNVRVKRDGSYSYEDQKFLCIKYNPGGEIRNYWDRWDDGHERKNNISYIIFKDDAFIINYDDVKIEDIDFYLNSRIDRRHYLYIMPLLWQVKLEKQKEYEQEKDFVLLVRGELLKKHGVDPHQINSFIWDAIEWWKAKKVKWKRPIKQDEAKALRMIIKRLQKQLKLN